MLLFPEYQLHHMAKCMWTLSSSFFCLFFVSGFLLLWSMSLNSNVGNNDFTLCSSNFMASVGRYRTVCTGQRAVVSTLIMSLALHCRRFTQTVQVGINTNISKSVQCVLSFRRQMIRLHCNWTWFGFIRNVVCTVLRSVLSTRLTVSQTD